MIVAALDLGTNSFLQTIAEMKDGKILKILSDELRIVRLGQDVDRTRRLHPEALQRAKHALQEFEKIRHNFAIQKVQAVATSAARDVENQNELFEICSGHGVQLSIIDGPTEARMTYQGAFAEFPTSRNPEDLWLVVDVGGGSTELILGQGHHVHQAYSLNIGAVRATERWVSNSSQAFSPETWDQLVIQIQKQVQDDLPTQYKNQKIHAVCAVAGTPTTLAQMELGEYNPKKMNGYLFSKETLVSWAKKLASVSIQERIHLYHVPEKRADILIAGTLILATILQELQQNDLFVSTGGVRYGLAAEISME